MFHALLTYVFAYHPWIHTQNVQVEHIEVKPSCHLPVGDVLILSRMTPMLGLDTLTPTWCRAACSCFAALDPLA